MTNLALISMEYLLSYKCKWEILLSRIANELLWSGSLKRGGGLLGWGSGSELESLKQLLHFPEEVALTLAAEEDSLFYQVPPIDYLRQVTLDLGGSPPPQPPGPHEHHRASVRSLIKRFNEVSFDSVH